MQVAVHGREMAPGNAEPLVHVLHRMQAHGLAPHLTATLAQWLHSLGHPVTLPVLPDDGRHDELDLWMGLGGDGTLLDTVARTARSGVPVLGINLGRLGFLSSVRLEQVDEALAALAQGRYALQDRSLLEVTDHRELLGDRNFALNEVSVTKRDSASMVAVHVHLGEEFLNTYWVDGLIIATPTGSTAYSLSCGGPILHPTSGALVINPISPHNLNVRPFVVPDHYTIRLQLEARNDRCLLNLDSRGVDIDGQGTVTIRRAPYAVKLVQLEGSSFLDTLRTKLNWGLDLRSVHTP
ncbi:MAG: NAD kinase [Flavobacteriales bacterium]|nr:NAD kinase [Flavobacteriales bacterium]